MIYIEPLKFLAIAHSRNPHDWTGSEILEKPFLHFHIPSRVKIFERD